MKDFKTFQKSSVKLFKDLKKLEVYSDKQKEKQVEEF